jgi:hypothetical protein
LSEPQRSRSHALDQHLCGVVNEEREIASSVIGIVSRMGIACAQRLAPKKGRSDSDDC